MGRRKNPKPVPTRKPGPRDWAPPPGAMWWDQPSRSGQRISENEFRERSYSDRPQGRKPSWRRNLGHKTLVGLGVLGLIVYAVMQNIESQMEHMNGQHDHDDALAGSDRDPSPGPPVTETPIPVTAPPEMTTTTIRDHRPDVVLTRCTSNSIGAPTGIVEVTNGGGDVASYIVTVRFESPDGSVLYGQGEAYIRSLNPGQRATAEVTDYFDVPEAMVCSVQDIDRRRGDLFDPPVLEPFPVSPPFPG